MSRVRPLEWVVIVSITLIVAAALWPVHGGHPPAKSTVCLYNVKQMGAATMIYMGDTDDRYPLRDAWMDALVPYTKDEGMYHCPLVPKALYGYALDSRRSGAKPPPDPTRATLLFESVNPIRNASDLVTSLPSPGRHGGKNNVAYADGHARAVGPHGHGTTRSVKGMGTLAPQ